jgi:hypothetical protein
MENETEKQMPVGSDDLFSGLTTRERRVMEEALEYRPGQWVRSEAEWLKCRGLGKQLLEKLRQHGLIEGGTSWPDDLSVRACNVLNNAKINPVKSEVKKALESGKLKPGKLRNYGKKTDDELREWAGAPSRPAPGENWYVPRKLWKFHPITGKPYPENAYSTDSNHRNL